MSRPTLIDPTDGPCEICAGWEKAKAEAGKSICNRCSSPFLAYQNMGGNGFQSVHPHHWHLEAVKEVAGRRAKYEELCHECYAADHKRVYPDQPAPQLPMILVDINAPRDNKLFRPAEGEVLEE